MTTEKAAIRTDKDLVLIDAVPDKLTEGVSLAKLTAFSLFWLHEWGIRRTMEAVSVLNWRLFPEKFAMVGFPKYPDSLRTNRSLLQGQPKYQNLLTGTATKGFSLNSRGFAIAEDLVRTFGVPRTTVGGITFHGDAQQRAPVTSSRGARTVDPREDVRRIKDSTLFDKWKRDVITERDIIHVHTLLGIFEHTPAKVRRQVFNNLKQSAEQVGDEEALQFLSDMHQRFRSVFVS
jgi:hypothetical protein